MATIGENGGPADGSDDPGAQAVRLADGVVTVYLPGDWTLLQHFHFNAVFDVSWLPGARLAVFFRTYEDPRAVRENNLAGYLQRREFSYPDDDPCSGAGDTDDDGRPIMRRYDGHTAAADNRTPGARDALSIWRRAAIAGPSHVRVVEFRLWFPEDREDTEDAESVRRFLDTAVAETDIWSFPQAADRIANTPALRTESFWNAIHMRVPRDWPAAELHGSDDDAPYKFDDPDPRARWTLWVNFTVFGEPGDGPGPFAPDRFAQEVVEKALASGEYEDVSVDPLPDRPEEAVVRTIHSSVEDGEPLRHVTWNKITHTGDRTISSQFRWVVIQSVADSERGRALTDLLEAEALNALITDPDLEPTVQVSANRR